jgi:chromosome segregation ATPase
VPGHQEFVEQLAAARVTTTRLRQENAALKSRLAEADVDKWKQKVEELQQRLAQGSRANDASLELVETELRAVRKSLQNREAQVQKIAGRLQENERSLKKALKESTRLTELLIERENRLRDLSTEYEQEYRDKIDNLDRQVSGLQWKLSLREERIASLESEVSELRRTRG